MDRMEQDRVVVQCGEFFPPTLVIVSQPLFQMELDVKHITGGVCFALN